MHCPEYEPQDRWTIIWQFSCGNARFCSADHRTFRFVRCHRRGWTDRCVCKPDRDGIRRGNSLLFRVEGLHCGPTLEVHLPLSFSVEADALLRPLNLTSTVTVTTTSGGASTSTRSTTFNSWEFPLLAKYRLPGRLIRPFVEAGPSFRETNGSPSDTSRLSSAGFTAGVGVEGRFGPIRIVPGVRYTRWGADSNANLAPFIPQSNINQAEFLVGLTF